MQGILSRIQMQGKLIFILIKVNNNKLTTLIFTARVVVLVSIT